MSLPRDTMVRSLVTDELVKGLLTAQHPDLADIEIGRRYTLENHFAIRIGDDSGVLFARYGD